MEGGKNREALADCTNTTSSYIKKPSPFRKLPNRTRAKTVIKSKSDSGFTSNANNENNCEVATANLSSAVVTSTPGKSSRFSGTGGECDLVEPCSVYSRRTADKRKHKGKAVALPVFGSPAVSFKTDGDKNKEDRVPALPKSFTEPCKKKKKDDSQHCMPPDYIEKQRAYFAEIDAFELPEEEVETIDELE